MKVSVISFGAAHIDIKAFSLQNVIWHNKNPAIIKTSLGGVARNIAENLARWNIDVALVSRVGQDQYGDMIIKQLTTCKVDTTLVTRSPHTLTATYTALLEPHGAMAVAFSDMSIYDEMSFENQKLYIHAEARIWIVDANIPEQGLQAIAHACPKNTELWAVGVSVAKNSRFLSILPKLDVLIINEDELQALYPLTSSSTLIETKGQHGAVLWQKNKPLHFRAIAGPLRDATGAGDAFSAGLLFGYLNEQSLENAVPYAMAAAYFTIQTTSSVCESLNREGLTYHARNYSNSVRHG